MGSHCTDRGQPTAGTPVCRTGGGPLGGATEMGIVGVGGAMAVETFGALYV